MRQSFGFGRAPALIAAFAAALLCAGCGGRPIGVLAPVAGETPGASRVDLMVATTRKSSPTPACCSPANEARRSP